MRAGGEGTTGPSAWAFVVARAAAACARAWNWGDAPPSVSLVDWVGGDPVLSTTTTGADADFAGTWFLPRDPCAGSGAGAIGSDQPSCARATPAWVPLTLGTASIFPLFTAVCALTAGLTRAASL